MKTTMTKEPKSRITHRVATYRDAGLDAKWGRIGTGLPVVFVRDPNATLPHQRNSWWMVTRQMFDRMQEVGVRQGFADATLLGDVFSVAV
jgi:hypothetical protein